MPSSGAGAPAVADPLLVLDRVSRTYGDRLALSPVTLTVDAGAVGVVRGPNGAGKTTLLRIAAGLLRPSRGTRSCHGRALYLRPGSGARGPQLVQEAVRFAASASGRSADQAAEALHGAGLAPVADRRVGTLSTGQRGRLTLALLLATAPALACLDEPTAQLDDDGRDGVLEAVRRLSSAGTGVLIATHDPEVWSASWASRIDLDDGRVRG